MALPQQPFGGYRVKRFSRHAVPDNVHQLLRLGTVGMSTICVGGPRTLIGIAVLRCCGANASDGIVTAHPYGNKD
jgi:hypothetical protein